MSVGRPFWNGPRMELTSVKRERSLWTLEYQLDGDGHSRYSYYSIDKFKDEIDVWKWWHNHLKEQTNDG